MKILFSLLFLLPYLPLSALDTRLDKLDTASKEGNFLEISRLKLELEKQLIEEKDPYIRSSLMRALWIEPVPLDENVIFDEDISALKIDGDDIWIGTRSGDIARYSLSERSWLVLQKGAPSLAIRSVNAIEVEEERVWFLSYGSLLLYDKRRSISYQLDLPDHPDYRGMQSLLLLGRGVLVGTQASGFRRILPRDETMISLPDLHNVSYLFQAGPDQLFAGTEEEGLFILDRNYTVRKAVENNRRTASVRAILPLGSGYLAGSYGNGLFLLSVNGQNMSYKKIYTPGNWITDGVKTHKGYCFSTLGNGLIYISGEELISRTFGISDGLPSLDITSIEYSAPYVVCGTQGRGLLVIHENFFD